jgi:hypothetical protein
VTEAPDLAATLDALQTVHDRWPDLEDARLKGTRRPHLSMRRSLTAQARAEMDARARIERAEADDHAPGFSPAPLHVDVLDVMANVLMWADALHGQVAQEVGHDRLDPAPHAYADARPYIAYTIELLRHCGPTLREEAAVRAEMMQAAMLMTLGEVFDGQELDAVCPFCMGRTFERLAGEITMRIRIVESRVDPDAFDFLVVCENPAACQPFSNEVDIWHEGKPAWRFQRWAWLAERLIHRSAA